MRLTHDLFLYEILDEYRESEQPERQQLFESFITLLWDCEHPRQKTIRYVSYHVPKKRLNTEIGGIFQACSAIPYTHYTSVTAETHWVHLLRQKINNIYTRLCDPEVCTAKEYLLQLKVPQSLYYDWIKNGTAHSPEELTKTLNHAFEELHRLKAHYARQKLILEWTHYQQLINDRLQSCFDRYVPLEDYEEEEHYVLDTELAGEDNYCIRYFCRSLDGHMRMYQKQYYGLRGHRSYRRCEDCGSLYERSKKDHRSRRCPHCAKVYRTNYYRENKRRQRMSTDQKSMLGR